MSRKTLLLSSFLAALSVALAAPPALGLGAYVRLYDYRVWGDQATSRVEVRLYDKDNQLKAVGRDLPSGIEGAWEVYLAPSVLAEPGDRMEVEHGLETHVSGVFPLITIDKVRVKANTVSGKVLPPRNSLLGHLEQEVLTLAGWEDVEYDVPSVEVLPDGSYTVNWAEAEPGPADLRRFDQLFVGYQDGVFVVFSYQTVPGLYIYKDTPWAVLFGPAGRSYEATLARRNGDVRATALATIFPEYFEFDAGPFIFTKGGKPVFIRKGNRLIIRGFQGFRARVPKLDATADTAADTVTVTTRPDTLVHIDVDLLNDDGGYSDQLHDVQMSDGDGLVTFSWMGYDIRPRDWIEVEILDATGNHTEIRKQILY